MPAADDASPRTAATVAAVALSAVWAAAIAFRIAGPRTVLPVDAAWNSAVDAWRAPAVAAVAQGFARIGTGLPAIAVTAIALAAVGLGTRRRRPVLLVAAASLVSVGDTWLMKQVAARVRPDAVPSPAATSFPSGHTANAAALGIAIALVVRTRTAWTIAAAWIVAMATSRTVLHAHWITDVVAATVTGAATAVLVAVVVPPDPRSRPAPIAPPPAIPAPAARIDDALQHRALRAAKVVAWSG